MRTISRIAFPLLLWCSALGVSCSAPGAPPPPRPAAAASPALVGSARSYAQARAVLEAGLGALGGLEAVRAVEDLEVVIGGHDFRRNESVKVDPPFDREVRDETLLVDVSRQRYAFEERDPAMGDRKVIVNDGQAFFVFPREREIDAVDPADVPTMTFNYLRQVPHLLLLHALEQRAATLMYLGQERFDGRAHDVVTLAAAHGAQLALFFDAQTHLLSKYEQMLSDPVDGDAVQETVFPTYLQVGAIKMATGRTVRRNGEVLAELQYTVRLNTRPPEGTFTKPAGFKETPPEPPTPPRETKLADGVYLFESDVNSLLVEFEDHLMVVEPHIGGRGPKAVMEKAREMFPGKPIRFVVITHHHFDHAAGVRPYVAGGVSLVTTPANRRYLERIANGSFTIAPDDQTKARRAPAFAFVEGGKRVFADSKQTVEVLDIGPNKHAQEMLIVYLPKEKLVFQADVLRLPADGTYPDTLDDETLQFAAALERLGLKVERITGVHVPVTTMAALREAIAKKQRTAPSAP